MSVPVSLLFGAVWAISWQGGPVIFLVAVAQRVAGRHFPARWRHALWLLVFARLLCPLALLPASSVSLARIPAPANPLQNIPVAVVEPPESLLLAKSPASGAVKQNPVLIVATNPALQLRPVYSWLTVVAFLWLAVVVAAWMAWGLGQRILLREILRAETPLPGGVVRAWQACGRAFGLRKTPRLLASFRVDSPLLLGCWRPRVVLPAGLLDSGLDEAELRHVFAHELGHYRRGDHWTNALQLLALSIHWFNPLVWYAVREARLDQEMAADEWALRRLGAEQRKAYGETLLKFISRQAGFGTLSTAVGIAENKARLKDRLRLISRFRGPTRLGSILGAVLLAALIAPVLSRATNLLTGLEGRGAIYDRNGVVLAETRDGKRHYPYAALGAPMLGCFGPDDHASSSSKAPDLIPRYGVEAALDPELRPGKNVYLTIDARIQAAAENAVRRSGYTHVAVVIMDPRDGDILALVSAPSFDPNDLAGEGASAAWKRLDADADRPLSNRAVRAFAPGSVFKPLTALAGLKSGRVSPATEFDCPAEILIDDHPFHNSDHSAYGRMGLVNALAFSNDVFFYQCGLRAGIDAIDELGTRAGFGEPSYVLGDDEDPGILPGPEWLGKWKTWMQKTHQADHWTNALTANTSIGQGFVLATPLQLTTFYSAIANGGTVYRPRLYARAVEASGHEFPLEKRGQVIGTLGVDQAGLDVVKEGLLAAVERGTGQNAAIPFMHVAGKTGNAQFYSHDHQSITTWFCCFAPNPAPRYAVTVMVEQGGAWGMTSAAPLAQAILRRLFDLEKGGTEELKPLRPIRGDDDVNGDVLHSPADLLHPNPKIPYSFFDWNQ
jgi:cell division protein FtsI/penicillin-binding protein 2/beta-lactamase regulating signal transducer with metallopeptidase domain